MNSVHNYGHGHVAYRSSLSLLYLVKITAVLTAFNTFLMIVSLLQQRFTIPRQQSENLELGRYASDPISSDVIQGSKLIILNLEELLQRSGPGRLGKPTLDSKNIFISVRSTNKYHKTRLKVLLDTWISNSEVNVWIFTDKEHDWLSQYLQELPNIHNTPAIIYTDCPSSTESKWALLCKMNWEYRTFLQSEMPWFCHFDDDNFVNVEMLAKILGLFSSHDSVYIGRSPSKAPTTVMAYDTENIEPEMMGFNISTNETDFLMPDVSYKRASFHFAMGGAGFCISKQLAIDMKPFAFASRLMHTASSIAMPDDCVIGYVITNRLNVSLLHTNLLHTHLEDLTLIEESTLAKQITLSYALPTGDAGGGESKRETLENAENSKFFYRNSTEKGFLKPRQSKANVVNIQNDFSYSEDPTRFRSLQRMIQNLA